MTPVDRATRRLVAASEALYQLGRVRDTLRLAGFKTSSSPLLRKVRKAHRSAAGAVRNAHRALSYAYMAEAHRGCVDSGRHCTEDRCIRLPVR